MKMPEFSAAIIDESIDGAFTTRGASPGMKRLRASKPFKRVTTFEQGCINYVWRMLCFDFAGFAPHNCMPITADFDLSAAVECRDGDRCRYGDSRRKELQTVLDARIKHFESKLPITAQRGAMQWARAFGVI